MGRGRDQEGRLAAFLDVSNTGPVLDAATVATLVEPFRRATADRSAGDGGFGLGLSIVDGVVNAHQGSMTLRPRPGGGLVVSVQLPVANEPGSAQVSNGQPAAPAN
jgi:two-component system, OmpR family, sensor histidine kinase VanS